MLKKFKKVKLNSDAILFYCKNDINTASKVRVEFACGSKHDGAKPGLAHLCEHMLFAGTSKHNKEEIAKISASFGYSNALTSSKVVALVGDMVTKQLPDYIDFVAELVSDSQFDKKMLEEEKKIVLQEIKGYADDHQYLAHNFNEYNLSELPLYINTTLGTEKTVKTITTADIKKFAKKFFVANNCKIFVCSPLSLHKIKKILNKQLLSKLGTNLSLKEDERFYMKFVNDKFLKNKFEDINKCYTTVNIVFDKPWTDFSFYNKLSILLFNLNMEGYGLHKLLRLDNNLVYYAFAECLYIEKHGVIKIQTESNKDNVNLILQKLADFVKTFAKCGIDQATLDIIHNKQHFEHAMAIKSPNSYMSALLNWKIQGVLIDGKSKYKERMNMPLDELNAMINEIFSSARFSCSVYGDIKKDELMSEKQFNKLFNSKK